MGNVFGFGATDGFGGTNGLGSELRFLASAFRLSQSLRDLSFKISVFLFKEDLLCGIEGRTDGAGGFGGGVFFGSLRALIGLLSAEWVVPLLAVGFFFFLGGGTGCLGLQWKKSTF